MQPAGAHEHKKAPHKAGLFRSIHAPAKAGALEAADFSGVVLEMSRIASGDRHEEAAADDDRLCAAAVRSGGHHSVEEAGADGVRGRRPEGWCRREGRTPGR